MDKVRILFAVQLATGRAHAAVNAALVAAEATNA